MCQRSFFKDRTSISSACTPAMSFQSLFTCLGEIPPFMSKKSLTVQSLEDGGHWIFISIIVVIFQVKVNGAKIDIPEAALRAALCLLVN